jgi:two-component system sensor histidine kinase/response regulator
MKLPLKDVSSGGVTTLETTLVTTAAGIDRQMALSRVGGDAELLKEIAQLFIDDYPKALEDIREAANRGDAKSLERCAHGLKGSVANFGAPSAVEAARKLESMGRAAQLAKVEEVQQMIRTLELALAALRPELESL